MVMNTKEVFEIYERYFNKLIATAFNIVGRVSLAEEVVQDVAIRILEIKPDFDDPAHCRNYLFRAVRNQAVNIMKSEKRSIPFSQEWLSIVADHTDLKDDSMFETLEWLRKSLEKQSPEIRDAFIRHVLYREKVADLAEELAIKPNTLAQCFHRIKIKLKQEALLFIDLLLIIRMLFVM